MRDNDAAMMIPIVATGMDWVYFLQPVNGGLIKIGKAVQVDRRITEIQNMNAVTLNVLAVERNVKPRRGTDRERALHLRFAKDRAHGEWFHPSAELVSYIGTLPQLGIDAFSFAKIVMDTRIRINAQRS